MIAASSMVVATKDHICADRAGEAVILHLRSGRSYGLAEAGARIWNLIREPVRVSEIRDTLLREYDVEFDRCERDVVSLLTQLADEGLIEVSDSPPAS